MTEVKFEERRHMKTKFFHCPSGIYDLDLSKNEMKVYLMLLDYWNEVKDYAFPSYITMCTRLNLQSSRLAKILSDLESYGLIKRSKRYNGKNANNIYACFIPTEEFRSKSKISREEELSETLEGLQRELLELREKANSLEGNETDYFEIKNQIYVDIEIIEGKIKTHKEKAFSVATTKDSY